MRPRLDPESQANDPITVRVSVPATVAAVCLMLGVAIDQAIAAQEPGAAPVRSDSNEFRLAPELRIGEEDRPEYALSWITAVAVDSTGAMYVGQPQNGTVRVYDAEGNFVRNLGSAGEGPGEFRSIQDLGWVGDTLWVLDPELGRITLFPGGDGEPVTLPVRREFGHPFQSATAFALLDGGDALIRPGLGLRGFMAGSIREVPVLRIDRSGQVRDTVFQDRVSRRDRLFIRTGDGGVVVSSNQPFTDHPLLCVGPEGKTVTVVDRSVAEGPRAARFRVTRLGVQSDTLWSRSFGYIPQRITPTIKDSVVTAVQETYALQFRTEAEARDAVREALFLPDFGPPVTDCLVGYDKRIWLRRDLFAADGTEWTVLDPNGRREGHMTTSHPLRLVAATREMAWAVEHGSFDIPYLVRYQIRVAEN